MIRALAILLIVVAAARAADPPVDFGREVLPILSDNCFFCHGPDAKARKADLRLDTKDGAFRVRDGESVILPGKSAGSELIRRLTAEDADERMPPPKSNRKLTARQIDTIRRWVDQGAKWGQPWALTPLAKPDGAASIDSFIRARLDKEGLKPSPEASREMWLRRVTLDLTGLPPTPKEADDFLKDTSADVYAKVVDRVLASDRYGERMASDWLDLARFADTQGYQHDKAWAVWPYRDWVIRAFNRNQRFDEFLTWQLAGDLLPNPTKEQRLATAFNRLHMQNEEGGIVEEEFRVAYVVDRVTTFGTAFLGLTFECSRCHDHKYDPIKQKDFYSLFAFFQNIDESGQTSYFTSATPVPTLLLSTDEQDRRIEELRKVVTEKEQALVAAREAAKRRFGEWKRPKELPIPGLVAAYSFDELKDNKVTNSVDAKAPGNAVEGPKLVPGKVGQAAELNGENGFTFPNVGHFSRTDPFSLSLWLKTANHAPRAVVLHHSQAPVDAGSRGYELLLEGGRVAVGLHHMWPGNSLKVQTTKSIPIDTWTQVTVTYDGSSTATGLKVYLNGEPAELKAVRDHLRKDITYVGNEPTLAIGHRFRDNGFKGGTVDEFRVYNRALTAMEVAQIAGKPTSGDLFDYYVTTLDGPFMLAIEELTAARRALSQFVNPIPEMMVMEEMKEPKPAYILKRGNYDQPGERVTADTPAALPPFPAELPRNRLGLARWLVGPNQALTARVAVNRLWQQMFGRGIVETADNFGSTGSGPSHPELLDWLAADFAEHGWDVKRTLKQIALSATYRQSAKVMPDLLAKDPDNRLLARMPARRLTAEMLRDQALFVSGLLVEKRGGPSVYPYQPDGLWNEAMGRPAYPRSKGPDLYRRTLYTFWKRTAPPPTSVAFDAADRSVCTVRRQSTSTPLQALALLNDPQIVEAARFLGHRMLNERGATRADQAAWAFRVVATRAATERERTILARLYDEQAALFEADPKAAERLLAVGDGKTDAKLRPADLAAATAVALTILNHDAAVVRR
jgi:mono/diheme cytochrome c family protein